MERRLWKHINEAPAGLAAKCQVYGLTQNSINCINHWQQNKGSYHRNRKISFAYDDC